MAVVSLGGLAFAGRMLRALAPFLQEEFGLLAYVGIVVCSASEAILLVLWLRIAASRGFNAVAFLLPVGFAVASVLSIAGSLFNRALVAYLIPLFSLASALMMLPYRRKGERPLFSSEGERERTPTEWSFPIKPVVLMASYCFAFYFSIAFTSGPSLFGPVGMLFVSVVSFFAALLFPSRYRASWLYRMSLPLMLVGLLLLLFIDTDKAVATMFANAGNVSFELFMAISLCRVCYKYEIPAEWVFSIVYGVAKVAGLVGSVVGLGLVGLFAVDSFVSNVCGVAIVAALVMCSLVFFSDRQADGTFGMVPTDDGVERPTGALSHYERLVLCCDQASRRFGLTHREQEVLEFLVQGFTMGDVAEKLFISNGTVKTHTIHIYRKMGIHSREEMMEMVGKAAGGSC